MVIDSEKNMNNLDESYDFEKERQEAVVAGRRALLSLKDAKATLDSARNWGVVDFLGGGMITTLVKHSKMNDAAGKLQRAKNNIQDFSDELSDIHASGGLSLETGDFLSFADFFFDGVLVDFLVQSRINTTRREIDDAIFRVRKILSQLENLDEQ